MGVRLALALLVGLAPAACRRGKDPAAWIDVSAAAVHCTTAGNTRMPPVLLGLPFPKLPTGLYARGLDPIGLVDMGYERDAPVCAALLPPDDDAIDAAAVRLATLSALIDGTSEAAVTQVACPCETADALGVRSLVAACATIAARKCADSQPRRQQLAALLLPLTDAIAGTPVPRLHWRLVGPTDRPTRFAEAYAQLLVRHAGGSVVYLAGQAVPARDNYVLIRALLDVPDVVAVARQDGGRALLVVRVVDGMQVLDHFELPAVRGEIVGLQGDFDNARVADIIAALTKPERVWTPLLPASEGNFAELDVEGLERIDRMLVAASPLSPSAYDSTEEERNEPDLYVARVSAQAPFGVEGQALRVSAQLTSAGALWATAMHDARLGSDVSALDLDGTAPHFVPPDEDPPAFMLRGTDTNAIVVHGIHAMGDVMVAIESNYPGTVNGTAHQWDFRMPQGALAHGGAIVPPPSLRALAEQVLERAYRVTATIDSRKGTIVADIAPD